MMHTTIDNAKRYVKRIILANISSGKDGLSITPLVSGPHGIGKSQMMKQLASELHGTCGIIEGGTLKEGEITGLPYPCRVNGESRFEFLPYHVIREMKEIEKEVDKLNIPPEKRLEAIKNRKVRLFLLFIDEINRTEPMVHRELMNILLTRTVNGYPFPWWVQIVAAMNPGSQGSAYAVNEMDPAQMDRFLKINVDSSAREWLGYAEQAGISPSVRRFIAKHPKALCRKDKNLEDTDKPTPSPRGWEMVNLLLESETKLRDFFTPEESKSDRIREDMEFLMAAKLGAEIAAAFFAECGSLSVTISPEDIFRDDAGLSRTAKEMKKLPDETIERICDNLLCYLKGNAQILAKKANRCRLNTFIKLLDKAEMASFAAQLFNSAAFKDYLDDVIDDDDIFDSLDLEGSSSKVVAKLKI